MQVNEISEFDLIAKLEKVLPSKYPSAVILGIGDDAAAIKISPGYVQLISSDSQVENTHLFY